MASRESPTTADYSVDKWELLDIPPIIEYSKRKDNNDSQNKTGCQNKERLCGYMLKLGAGIIKSWKRRWFTFDERRCFLFYYRKPQDTEPLGYIDIANASFSFNPEHRSIFQISSRDRVYQLEAPDKTAMMFWLQELQLKRRDFNKSLKGKQLNRPTSGLLSEDFLSEGISDDEVEVFNKPINMPHNVGESSASHVSSEAWDFSFSNINKEFKNWRKSSYILTGEPMLPESSEENEQKRDYLKTEKKSPKSQRNAKTAASNDKPPTSTRSRMVDFGFSRMVANLRNSSLPTISNPLASTNQSKTTCQDCLETSSMIKVLQEAISVAEKEITTRDDVIESLSEQLRLALTTGIFDKSTDDEVTEEREHYVLQLTRMVKKLNEELESTKAAFAESKKNLEKQEEKGKIYKEMLQAKDNAIISLTNEIFSLQAGTTVGTTSEVSEAVEEFPTSLSASPELLDYNQLQETCTAYESQNKFLNSEILEMSRLRKVDNEMIQSLTEKFDLKEAEYLKLKSRYLLLLKDYSPPTRDCNLDAGLVELLINDALNENSDANSTKSPEYRFSDKYGFYDEFNSSDGDNLENLADQLEVKVGDKEQTYNEASTAVKWENFLVTQGKATLERTEELKFLARMGIPHEFRARVWGDLVNLRIVQDKNVGPGYYKNLLKEKHGVYSPSNKQIELDLLRTLPNNKYYDHIDSQGISKLRRILLAYSWHNPAVGYCQGLNRLGAIALLYLDEEMSFWSLVAITEHLMPIDYYSHTLLGAQIDQKVLRDLIDEKCPKLGAHLSSLQFDISLIAFNWFLTVFVDLFPIELTLRVWDTFLFEGSKVLFRFALAIFKLFEEDLLKFRDTGSMFNYFRNLPKSRFDIHKIAQISFTTLNPFSRRNVETKRNYYRPILQAQLDKFEVMREEYREKRDDSISSKDESLSDDEN